MRARSVVAAAIDGVTGELFQARLTSFFEHIRAWCANLSGPVAVPNTPKATRPRRADLVIHIGSGDHTEPVLTVMTPTEG